MTTMRTEEQGTLLTLDPDARPARVPRSRAGRSDSRGLDMAEPEAAEEGGVAPVEATLSLEPLRLPITAMVQGTLRAEREVLERLGTDVRDELEQWRAWKVREETMRADQSALYARAVEAWDRAGA